MVGQAVKILIGGQSDDDLSIGKQEQKPIYQVVVLLYEYLENGKTICVGKDPATKETVHFQARAIVDFPGIQVSANIIPAPGHFGTRLGE